MIKSAQRCENIRYAVRDIIILAEKAKAKGIEPQFLNIGDPVKFGFNTPRHMIEAVYRAMLEQQNNYAPSSGTDEAIEAIHKDATKKGMKNIKSIFVTQGTSEAIEVVLTALLNQDENVLTPAPGYPCYSAVQAKLSVYENQYMLDEKNGWMPDPDDIRKRINSKTKAIVIINPNNPTGSVTSPEILKEIVKIAAEKELLILSDEIYEKIIFDGLKNTCIATINPDQPIITFNGISKSYCAPGFRMGWGIISGNTKKVAELDEAINKLLRQRLCACTPQMSAIKAALEGPTTGTTEFVTQLQKHRDLLYKRLNEIEGVSCVKPKGAFYAFPKLENVKDGDKFVHSLIENTGMVVVPGSGFGLPAKAPYFRIVFLPDEKILNKAFTGLEAFIKTWKE